LNYLTRETLGYKPGLVYHYSNVGYCLLGHMIREVSGQDYPVYLQNHLLRPAGLTNSGFVGYDTLQDEGLGYAADGSVVERLPRRNIPAGGMDSTIDDMLALAQEFLAAYHGTMDGVLSPRTMR